MRLASNRLQEISTSHLNLRTSNLKMRTIKYLTEVHEIRVHVRNQIAILAAALPQTEMTNTKTQIATQDEVEARNHKLMINTTSETHSTEQRFRSDVNLITPDRRAELLQELRDDTHKMHLHLPFIHEQEGDTDELKREKMQTIKHLTRVLKRFDEYYNAHGFRSNDYKTGSKKEQFLGIQNVIKNLRDSMNEEQGKNNSANAREVVEAERQNGINSIDPAPRCLFGRSRRITTMAAFPL